MPNGIFNLNFNDSEQLDTIHIKNLNGDIKEDDIYNLFARYGRIKYVKKIKNFAFVKYYENNDALTAMHKEDGKYFGKNKISVEFAKIRDPLKNINHLRESNYNNLNRDYNRHKLDHLFEPMGQSTPYKRKNDLTMSESNISPNVKKPRFNKFANENANCKYNRSEKKSI